MEKLLVITSRFPYPLDKGDKLRAYHQIKALAKYYAIHLVCLTDDKIEPQNLDELNKYCVSIKLFRFNKFQLFGNLIKTVFSKNPLQVGYFYSKKFHKEIKKEIQSIEPAHIYCQLVRCAEYVKDAYEIPKTIDYMDTLSKGMERRIPSSPYYIRPLLRLEAKRLKRYESVMFDYFNHHTIISKQDQELIFLEDRDVIAVIPNGIDVNYFSPRDQEKKYDLLFNGNMQYEPNVVGAIYIAKKILPIVHKTHPNVNLLISGTSPTKEVQALANEHVTVSGWMKDIRDAYGAAKVFIAPMQIGTGLQNKLLEAMAMKIPSITSKLANNALKAVTEKEIIIGNTPEEYAKAIIDLLEQKEFAKNIGENGYNYVTKTFNWETSTKALYDLMKSSS